VASQGDNNTVIPAHYLIDGVSPPRAQQAILPTPWIDPD
jgi:hypothetical protein